MSKLSKVFLTLALLAGFGAALIFALRGQQAAVAELAPGPATELVGVIALDVEPFFKDERVRKILADNRLPASLQAKVLELCKALESLLAQWERSKGALSLQEGFHARHIAISCLPDALKAYLSIPAQYASTRVLHDGKTAQEIFRDTLIELEGKLKELADDLAGQDAHAFLVHSRFLHDKFGNHALLQAPDTPSPTEAPHAKL